MPIDLQYHQKEASPCIPTPQLVHDGDIPLQLEWGDVSLREFVEELDEAYDEISRFRKNLFKLPSGESGKSFLKHYTFWLKKLNYNEKYYKDFVLKAFMVMPALIMQKPSKK